MKKLFYLIFVLLSLSAVGQNPRPTLSTLPQKMEYKWYQITNYLTIDSGLTISTRDTNWVSRWPGTLVRLSNGIVCISLANTTAYGDHWDQLAGGGGGSESTTVSSLGGGLDIQAGLSGFDIRINTLTASDFNVTSNLISIDYTNGQAANGSTKGFLTSADWTTFNNKFTYSLEVLEDDLFAAVSDGNTINFNYDDIGNTLTAEVITQMSLTSDASGIKLVGDVSSPGNDYFYGTNGSGVKGWYNMGSFADENFAKNNLTATADRTHDFANFFLKINNLSELELKSSLSTDRYSIISDNKPFFTGLTLYSQFNAADATGVYVSNSNGGSNIYMEAFSQNDTDYSAFGINPDSLTFYPDNGFMFIDSLRMANSDTAGYKPMVWNIHNKSWRYFNSWGELGLGGGTDINIYEDDGTLTADRTVTMNGNDLFFTSNANATWRARIDDGSKRSDLTIINNTATLHAEDRPNADKDINLQANYTGSDPYGVIIATDYVSLLNHQIKIWPDSILLSGDDGASNNTHINVPNLPVSTDAADPVLVLNNGRIKMKAQSSIGGSGGHTIKEEGTPLTNRTGLNFVGTRVTATDDAGNNETDITITADGLDEVLAVNQALTANRSVPTSAFSLTFNSSNTVGTILANNSSTGTSLSGINSSSGIGVWAESATGMALYAFNSGTRTANQPTAEIDGNWASTNSNERILYLTRSTTGTAADGISGSIDFLNETHSPSSLVLSSRIISGWSTADNTTRTGFFAIQGVNNGAAPAEQLRLKGTGQLQLNGYGSGTFTGTDIKWLAVDASGNIIEENPPSGSGTVTDFIFTDANGFDGTVTTSTTTPTLSLTTTVSNGQVMYSNSGAIVGSANLTYNAALLTGLSASLGTTQDDAKGIVLINNTAAAAGAQQISPSMRWSGQGWKTNATAASQEVEFRSYVLPIEGTSAPFAEWLLESSINAAAYVQQFAVTSAGSARIGSGGTIPSNISNSLTFGTGVIGSNGGYSIAMNGSTANNINAIVLAQNATSNAANTLISGQNSVIASGANGASAFGADHNIGALASYAEAHNDANDVYGESAFAGNFGNDVWATNGFAMVNSNILGAISGSGTANQYTDEWTIGTQNRNTGHRNGSLGYYTQVTSNNSYVLGTGILATGNRLKLSWENAIGFGTNSDSATVLILPAEGTTGTYGDVMIRGIGQDDAETRVMVVQSDGLLQWRDASTLGGYTTLSQFVSENNWKMYHSNGSGDITEIPIGVAGSFLKSAGTTSAPGFTTVKLSDIASLEASTAPQINSDYTWGLDFNVLTIGPAIYFRSPSTAALNGQMLVRNELTGAHASSNRTTTTVYTDNTHTGTTSTNIAQELVASGGTTNIALRISAGEFRQNESSAPGTPPTGFGTWYVSSSDSKPHFISDGGTDYDLTSGGSGGHTIKEEGTPLTARAGLNFVGAGITASDDAGNDETDVTLDADLNTIAGLTATTDNFIVSVSSAWASRTPAEVRTTLGLVIGTNVQAWDTDLDTWAGITPAAGIATWLATPSSSNLATAVTDETGTGALVFGTSPRITTGINDANGNELFLFTATASAVNELTYANAATGTDPRWTASGEANVGIEWLAKGTGVYKFLATTSNATKIRVYEDADNGSNYAEITAPTTLGNNYTLTIPTLTANETFAVLDLAQTFTNKTINLSSNTLSGTTAQFNTALSDNDFATLAGTETLSGKTLTTPRFANAGYIADNNGNELIIFTTTASAVNEWTLANGATGVNPKLTASGETNVGLDFQVKGTGVYNWLATASGPTDMRWYEDTDNGTNYVSLIASSAIGSNVVATLPTVTGTIPVKSQMKFNNTFNLQSPTSSENFGGWFTPVAITIDEVRGVMIGSSQSVTLVVNYGASRATADGTIVASNTFDSGDSGYQTTGFAFTLNTTSIPANSWIWLTTSATSGTINDMSITVTYQLQ